MTNTNVNIKNIEKLNQIYRSILGRSVDSSGLDSYLKYTESEDGINFIKQQLVTSAEYRKLRTSFDDNNFNSLAGDRISYISSDDTSELDKSSYSQLLDYLIESIMLVDYPYPEDLLYDRVKTVKKSLIHIHKAELRFTILPHKEFHFNTENFIECKFTSVQNITGGKSNQ